MRAGWDRRDKPPIHLQITLWDVGAVEHVRSSKIAPGRCPCITSGESFPHSAERRASGPAGTDQCHGVSTLILGSPVHVRMRMSVCA